MTDTALWIFVGILVAYSLAAGYAWWIGYQSHQRINDLEEQLKNRDQAYAALLKKVNDLESAHPFSFMRRAN